MCIIVVGGKRMSSLCQRWNLSSILAGLLRVVVTVCRNNIGLLLVYTVRRRWMCARIISEHASCYGHFVVDEDEKRGSTFPQALSARKEKNNVIDIFRGIINNNYYYNIIKGSSDILVIYYYQYFGIIHITIYIINRKVNN